MNKRTLLIIAVLAALTLTAAECSVSTANIPEAYMAADPDGAQPTTTYTSEATFYAIVTLANAPDGTTLKASWYAVNAEGTEPNFLIDEASITGSDGVYTFDLTNQAGFICRPVPTAWT
jgi:hypothetical protein